MSTLLTALEVAAALNLRSKDGQLNKRAVYALPIARVNLSARRTRWRGEDVEEHRIANGIERPIPPARKLPSITALLKRTTKARMTPGVYFLLQGREVVYVGQSRNPLYRIGQHSTKLAFDSFAVLHCDEFDLLAFEGSYILKFRPRFNKNGL